MELQKSYIIVSGLTIDERKIIDLVNKKIPALVNVAEVLTGKTRQTVSANIKKLIEKKYIVTSGNTKAKIYKIGKNRAHYVEYDMVAEHKLDEGAIWNDFEFIFESLPGNVYENCYYGFTEMVNNAIDHSDGSILRVCASLVDDGVDIMVHDNGEGIFKRIARICKLASEKESILELAKGKLTTDPANHTGEGIYFTSRVFDIFYIYSSGHLFDHDREREADFLIEHNNQVEGTIVEMQIHSESKTRQEDIFNEHAPADEFSFSKTVVPVRLAKQGRENLVSRSQAKRVLARLDSFKTVILDFEGVDTIGQAFADEIFRVWTKKHPGVTLVPANTNEDIDRWISRAINQ